MFCDVLPKVPVSPGMKHEQRIPFRGEADEMVRPTSRIIMHVRIYSVKL